VEEISSQPHAAESFRRGRFRGVGDTTSE
jgi:hypothetical protein